MFPVFPGQKLSPISVDNSWDKNKTVFTENLTILEILIFTRPWLCSGHGMNRILKTFPGHIEKQHGNSNQP